MAQGAKADLTIALPRVWRFEDYIVEDLHGSPKVDAMLLEVTETLALVLFEHEPT